MNLREFSELRDVGRAIGALRTSGRLRGVPTGSAPQPTTHPAKPEPAPAPAAQLTRREPAISPSKDTLPGATGASRRDEPAAGALPPVSPATSGIRVCISGPRAMQHLRGIANDRQTGEAGFVQTELRDLDVAEPQAREPASRPSEPDRASAAQSQLPAAPKPQVARVTAALPPPPAESAFLSDRITATLVAMCRRGGFTGALIADASGLPLAEYNCDSEVVAACCSVLGGALDQTARLLDQRDANNIALDINYVEKYALRRFQITGDPHYLIIQCPQSVDERSEVELAIEELIKNFSQPRYRPDGGEVTRTKPVTS